MSPLKAKAAQLPHPLVQLLAVLMVIEGVWRWRRYMVVSPEPVKGWIIIEFQQVRLCLKG